MPSTRPHASPLTITTPLRIGRLVAFLTLLVLGMLACSEGARANGSAEPLQPGDVVLLDFNARWCGPCRAMAPVVQGIEQAGWPVRHIDVDQEHDLVRRFSVTGVPCYVLLVRGHEVGRIAGATTQQELEGLLTKGHRKPPPCRSSKALPASLFRPPPRPRRSLWRHLPWLAVRGLP
jgi:thiol-disulfide isomerase/thioredoxin